MKKRSNTKHQPAVLQGWRRIAEYLAQPVGVVQRWAKSGMPIMRDGRRVHAVPEELDRWLASESAGEPVHIASENTDLGSELTRGLSYLRKHERRKRGNKAA